MGYLTVFCENDCPHSGCIIEDAEGNSEWLSFMPKPEGYNIFPGGNFGWIDTNNREGRIDTYARFFIEDNELIAGRNKTVIDYQTAHYGLFINDCINFSSDMSRNCGLISPKHESFPSHLVAMLKLNNPSKLTHTNTKPFPWHHLRKKESK